MTKIKSKYLAPGLKHSDLRSCTALCKSGEKYHLPQGIEIADFDFIYEADDNDW